MPKAGTDTRVDVECTGCGAAMKRYPSQLKLNKTGRWFCGTECRDRVGSKPRRKAMVNCEQCKTDFYPRSGQLNRYCSKACHDNSQRVGSIERICAVCGKVDQVKPSYAHLKHCSRHCYDVGRDTPIGKRARNDDGYIVVFQPGSPEAWKGKHRRAGWAMEHRVVMADSLGHALPPGSTVHHRNGIRDDNRIENLELWASAHKPGQRVLDLIDYARLILETYGPDEDRLRELAVTCGN